MTPVPRTAIQRLDEAAVDLLSTVGMKVEHGEARSRLAAAGATVDGELVRLSPDLLREAIDAAPTSFEWHARDPSKTVTVGAGDPVVAPTRGPRYVKRPGQTRHRATMDDFETLVKLIHQESAIDVVGYDLCSPKGYSLPGNPGGFDQVDPGYELLEALFTGTDKPVVGSARSGADAATSLEMARIAFEEPELREPSVLGILHVRSPRVFNEPMVEGLLAFAEAGQPLVVSSGAIPGASAPHSLAEAAVQVFAEALFGAAFVQLVNPGTPVVFGRSGTVYDRSAEAVSAGLKGVTLQDLTVAMAEFYDLPSRGSGGATDAKAIDDQSGSESMYHLEAAMDSGADLLLNATGGLDTYATVSPEKIVLDAARIRTLKALSEERSALQEALETRPSLATIREAAPGDLFFDERDPKQLADTPSFGASIGSRESHDDWVASGQSTLAERATERVLRLLEAYEQPPIDQGVADRLAAHSD